MFVTIRLFARLREVARQSELHRRLPDDATVATAWHALAVEFPELADHAGSISAAVNDDYARFTAPLTDGDEVAFLPPVSGGAKGNRAISRSGLKNRAISRSSHLAMAQSGDLAIGPSGDGRDRAIRRWRNRAIRLSTI